MSRRQKTGWIGIDFGSRAIKIAQTERAGSGLRLRDAMVMQRDAPRAPDSDGRPPLWRTDEIRAALAMAPNLCGRMAACCVSPWQSTIRTLRIPPGTPHQLQAMIRNQLATRLPMGAAHCTFDFWETSAAGTRDEEQVNMAVVYLEDDFAVQVAGLLHGAGLECEILDGHPLPVARAAQLIRPTGDTSATAAIDWGYNRVTFSVVREGRPLFTRDLRRCGLREVIAEISGALGVSHDDAQQVLSMYGVPGEAEPRDATTAELQKVVAEIAAPRLQILIHEMEKTTDYLRFHRTDVIPDKLYLLGGGAAIRNIDTYLDARIKLPVALWLLPVGSARVMSGSRAPLPMLASAIALSALAWSH